MCYFVVLADSKDVDISVVSSSAASTFDLEKLGWRALGFCKGARGCCKGLTGLKRDSGLMCLVQFRLDQWRSLQKQPHHVWTSANVRGWSDRHLYKHSPNTSVSGASLGSGSRNL